MMAVRQAVAAVTANERQDAKPKAGRALAHIAAGSRNAASNAKGECRDAVLLT